MMPALHNFITTDPTAFISNPKHLEIIYNICKKVSCCHLVLLLHICELVELAHSNWTW